jgi:phosphoserine phosphatase RsbU/P
MSTPPLATISPEHLRTLYEVSQVISSSLEFDAVLNSVIDGVMTVTHAQRGFLMVADEQGTLSVRVANGIDSSRSDPSQLYSTSVVNKVVESRQALLTNNAQTDERFVAGQSIIMRGLRSVLCAPMIVQDRLIGVIYVDSTLQHGNFTSDDLRLLSAVAGQAGIALENARLYAVAIEKGRLERELQMARELQQSLLPQHIPAFKGGQLAAQWRSAREVAGDFYDFLPLSTDQLGILIADVSDKGAPAAMFMASTRSMIRSLAQLGFSPVETLSRTNDLMVNDSENGMFVTAYYAVLHPNGMLHHVNAGHPPPLIYRAAAHSVETLSIGGRALGWFNSNPLSLQQTQLFVGDVVLFFTDGITDAQHPQGESFGDERLKLAFTSAVQSASSDTIERVPKHILDAVDQFCEDSAPFDDITLVALRFTGGQ